ncbi:MAG: ABC transporter permease [Spirochaetales bacterium]|nr:ABC transporter permease [Spirochaetales bacterium]
MSARKIFANVDTKLWTLAIIMVGVIVVLTLVLPGDFLTLRNFQSMAYQFPEFGLLALAMTIAMITGGIDLSVIATANLTGIVAALVMTSLKTAQGGGGAPDSLLIVLAAVGLALALAALCGLVNGALIALVGVPPILATLGTMIFYSGVGMAVTKGIGVVGFPESFLTIGAGKLWLFPIPLLIFVAAAVVVSVLLNRSTFGLKLYLVGANPTAALFSGINNNLVIIKTYVITGILAGVSSMIMISRFNSAKVGYGDTYLLQAILVAVLGGIDPYGGSGKVTGVVMGIVILQVLQNAFTLFGFTPYAKGFIWGLMLILVMIINFVTSRHQERSKIMRLTER